MKQRLRLFPLMMSLCLLTACGGGGEKQTGEDLALQIQGEFAAMTACTGRFSLEADYGNRVFDCVLDVTYDQVTGGVLTIVEPELVRGVSARITQDGASLSYEGFSLDTGAVTDDGLSPMEAVPRLYQAVTRDFVAGATLAEETLSVTYRDGEQAPGTGLEAVVTFDAKSHAPLTGELFWDGVRVITVQVTSFEMMPTAAQQG